MDSVRPVFNSKGAILQETRIFSKIPINSKKCAKLLTRILSLLNCGSETLMESESSSIFFGVTRLFEADDERLRRLIYLLIKSLPVNETEIFIVTSSLTKDMNSNNHVYRANAIRSICCIMRGPVSSQIERYLKSSLVDKQPYVSCSTLLCCIGMYERSSDLLKRWFSEITTCLSNKNEMVRFHATILLFLLRFNDKQSIRKLISGLEGGGTHVVCFIIRFLCANSSFPEAASFIARGLTNEDPAVKLESCKAITSMLLGHIKKGNALATFEFDLGRVVDVLKNLLLVGDIFTFAALRQMSVLAQVIPDKISALNKQLENYISSKNRSLSSFALVTLLQTGSSKTIENLLTQASSLSGDFKLEVTRAIKRLCLAHPDKYKLVLKFLALNFRMETSFKAKSEMVDATIFLVNEIPAAQSSGLMNLCELIEDCEYPEINVKVLKFLGENVPKAKNPQDYVRSIYNRLILENALVRSASINALENIANKLPELRECIFEIIRTTDTSDNYQLQEEVEVIKSFMGRTLKGVGSNGAAEAGKPLTNGKAAAADKHISDDLFELYLKVSDEQLYLDDLRVKLLEKVENGTELAEYSLEEPKEDPKDKSAGESEDDLVLMPLDAKAGHKFPDEVANLVGEVMKTTTFRLTEEEEDYNVTVDLFVNMNHVLFKFNVENTLNNQYLKDVSIKMKTDACTNLDKFREVYTEKLDTVDSNDSKSLHHVYRNEFQNLYDWCVGLLMGSVEVYLNFTVVCPTETYSDSFKINNLVLSPMCYISPLSLEDAEYKKLWNELEQLELSSTFNLNFSSLEQGIVEISKFLGLTRNTEGMENKIAWTHLAGSFVGVPVFAKASFAQPSADALILKLQLRSRERCASELLMALLG